MTRLAVLGALAGLTATATRRLLPICRWLRSRSTMSGSAMPTARASTTFRARRPACASAAGYAPNSGSAISARPKMPGATATPTVTSGALAVILYLDARTATEFGTLRSFIEMYVQQQTNDATSTTLDKAYIQWGGLLAGRTSSNFDFFTGYSWNAQIESYSDQTRSTRSPTRPPSATVSAQRSAVEDRSGRETNIGLNGGTLGYGGTRMPDIVGALALSQGWGSAQVMGALHQVYPNATFNGITGNSEDELGWAVGAGVEVEFGGPAQRRQRGPAGVLYRRGQRLRLHRLGRPDHRCGLGRQQHRDHQDAEHFRRRQPRRHRSRDGQCRRRLPQCGRRLSAYDFTQWSATATSVWEPGRASKWARKSSTATSTTAAPA